ncbi:MAG: hypothetical protein KJN71_05275, partial [Acidimicrobiia bacterium]|nr:hypothetical protein [Acidimicrobiia bacterium]
MRELISRITRLEIIVAAVIAVVLLALVVIEPKILEAPFENERTLLFTFGGTVLAALALVAMLWFRVPPIARIIVLVVPFLVVNWWLISPYFVDDVVEDAFSTSISEQLGTTDDTPTTTAPPADADSETGSAVDEPSTTDDEPPPPPEPSGPVLLGAG